MPELHPINGHQITAKPVSNTRRVIGASECDSAPFVDESMRRNWEMFMIWSFVVVSFAAFFFCLWDISATCHGDQPDLTNRNEGITTKEMNQIGKSQ